MGPSIIAYIYEIPKRAPVAVVFDDGRVVDLDPYDVGTMLDLFRALKSPGTGGAKILQKKEIS